jgi:hypothetical protein
MNKRIIILTVLAAAALIVPLAAADKKPLESQWTGSPLVIDAKMDEWPAEALTSNKNFEISYAFKNDQNFLYCIFVFNNPRYLSSIEASGLTFWIHPQKEKKAYGFRFYRKMVTPDQLIQTMEKGGTPLTEQKKTEIKSKPSYMLFACDVVDKKGNVVLHQAGTGNGTYRVARAQKSMVFEYVIPLGLLVDADQKPLNIAEPFKLGFEWGGMTEEMKKQRAAEIGGQNSEARGGTAEMAVSGGIGERGEGEERSTPSADLTGMRRGPKKYEFWIDLKLAAKQ